MTPVGPLFRPERYGEEKNRFPLLEIINSSSIWAILINPLTPELNPSAQRCLTKFFTWDFAS
jgi:hypothetical protein